MPQIDLNKTLPEHTLTHISQIVHALGGKDKTRIVGGAVRDILLEKPVWDIDLASILTPDEVIVALQQDHIRFAPTGLKYGTVSAIINRTAYQITTLRSDIECYGRKAEVQFGTDWEADAVRRDFSINAMFMDIDGNIFDYCGGMQDIINKLIRFVGEPQRRIKEDALRILRYFRLYSHLGWESIDKQSFEAVSQNAQMTETLSRERTKAEFEKIFSNPFLANSLKLMQDIQFLPHIRLPHAYKIHRHYSNEWLVNLFTMFIDLPNSLKVQRSAQANFGELSRLSLMDTVNNFASHFRFSVKEQTILNTLCKNFLHYYELDLDMPKKQHIQMLYKVGKDQYCRLIRLHNILHDNSYINLLAELMEHEMEHFPVSGDDILALGISGKAISVALKKAKDSWIASDTRKTKATLLLEIKSLFH